jgi:lipopolysaccharide export LptBFGC system permease protein LptF
MRVNFTFLLNTGFVSSVAAGFSGRGAKPVVFMLGLLLFGAVFLPAQSAEAIVDSARNRIGAETVTSRSRMVLTDKKGGTSERIIDQFSKKNADGDRTLIVFQRPASIAGTRFLTIENNDKSNDKWIFLPNLGRVRRIAASEGSGSFIGTDMSYDDIASASRDVSLDTHTLLREEAVNGQQMYVIESVPKDKGYQYSRMVQWIGKTDKITHKIELYNKRGALHKVLEVLTVKIIQNYETPVVTRMTTISAGTSTTINVDTLKYDDPMPDGIFSQSYLETGRL